MQPKPGWWKQNDGGYAFLVGMFRGVWLGVDSKRGMREWMANGDFSSNPKDPFNLTDVFCGDGPEPIEPVQVCLGWWERRDGGLVKIERHVPGIPYPWRDSNNHGYMDNGQWLIEGDIPEKDIVKRRPDLDAAEQPDPRDAEIERLKSDNEDLRNQLRDLRNNAGHWRDSYNTLKTGLTEMASKIEDLVG